MHGTVTCIISVSKARHRVASTCALPTRAVRLRLCFCRRYQRSANSAFCCSQATGLAAQPQAGSDLSFIYESQPMDYTMFCEDGPKLVGTPGASMLLYQHDGNGSWARLLSIGRGWPAERQ